MYRSIAIMITLVLMMFATVAPAAEGCWDTSESADIEFAEMDATIVLSFKDAVKCLPVTHAEVTIDGEQFETDSSGYVILPLEMFKGIENKSLPMSVKKDGYITLEDNISVMLETVWKKKFILTKEIPLNNVRFVLQWGDKPRDLDLHLVGDDFHVSFRKMRSVPNKAHLDRDDMRSFGPETVTLLNVDVYKTYDLYVHNYSGESKINDEAMVYVYADGKLKQVVKLPKTSKRAVHVVQIHRKVISYPNLPVDNVGNR